MDTLNPVNESSPQGSYGSMDINATTRNVTYDSTDTSNLNPSSLSMSSISFQMNPSPLPPAEVLKQYSEIIPDAPERFLSLVEKEQEHRFKSQDEITRVNANIAEGKIKYIKRGQIFGFIMAIIILTLGTVFVFTGHDNMAYVLFTLCLVSVIATFIGKSKDNVKEPPTNNP